MRVTYTLSNRQRKELLVRGQQLLVAIPLGPDDDIDPVQFARDSLAEDHEWVTEAEIADVMTCASGAEGGLNNILGQILDFEYDVAINLSKVPSFVAVVIATLTPPNCRGEASTVQWPGSVYIDGVKIDRKKSTDKIDS
jgi:hypothetical protein